VRGFTNTQIHKHMKFNALDRQKEIYVGGFGGSKPLVPSRFDALEREAEKRMSAEAFAYIAGGAGLEVTMDRNRSGFEKVRILPRMLQDVSERDISIELLGQKLPAPVLTAPIGVLEMAHPEGDLAVARAASSLGIPMIFSNQASHSMEACAAEMGSSPRWFQLYWSKSDDLTASLLQRAEACGCSAIVLTLDTTMLGWRPRDLDLAYLPFLRGLGIAQYTSDPVFQKMVADPAFLRSIQNEGGFSLTKLLNFFRLVKKYPGDGSFFEKMKSKIPVAGVRKFIEIYSRPSITWADLAFLKKHTRLPILLKGILHPGDARKAVDHGMGGLIVSNHGGRQVSGSIAAIEALPGIAEAVNRQIPVLLDSGIREGADIFRALALGAHAVCIGRPYVYGLAIGGQAGVEEVLKNLVSDFELTMGLSGCRNVGEINRETVEIH
jgi:lactate 2-monooxygenase